MYSSRCPPSRRDPLKVLCVRVCVLYYILVLTGGPLPSEAARLRCGSDLLSDLIFVCGDRGIYFGKGTWSGYGARPRGKGIVDQCCRPAGCELQHLEMYCAKPKTQPQTSTSPPTTAASTSTAPPERAEQFEAVFRKKLLQHLGAPNSPKRDAYRKKAPNSLRRKGKMSSSRRKMNAQSQTSRPPAALRRRMRTGS